MPKVSMISFTIPDISWKTGFQPEDAAQKAKSEYKDVVIGENVWRTLEEIMGYMREPMRYYDRGMRLPRVSWQITHLSCISTVHDNNDCRHIKSKLQADNHK